MRTSTETILNIGAAARSWWRPPTDKQLAIATKLGITTDNQTRRNLSKCISQAFEEEKQATRDAYERADQEIQYSESILDYAEQLTEMKQDGPNWYSGPCPKCGGDDRFYINTRDNLFRCREGVGRCQWAGGIAQLAAYLWNCSTWDAIDAIKGHSLRDKLTTTTTPTQPIAKSQPKLAQRTAQLHDYHLKVTKRITRAKNTLLYQPEGEAGRNYLSTRSLVEESYHTFDVGYDKVWEWDKEKNEVVWLGKYGIAFLHTDINGKPTGINRRILPPYDGERKTKFYSGDQSNFFGIPACQTTKAILIVEGEINALSIWGTAQYLKLDMDVIAVGGQEMFKKLSVDIQTLINKYQHAIIWADDKKYTEKIRELLQHQNLIVIQSPHNYDANDLLKEKFLASFLERVLPDAITEPDAGLPPANSVIEIAESGLTATEELLDLCGWLAHYAGDSQEAIDLYRQAEDIFMEVNATKLNDHYQHMKARLPHASATQMALTL